MGQGARAMSKGQETRRKVGPVGKGQETRGKGGGRRGRGIVSCTWVKRHEAGGMGNEQGAGDKGTGGNKQRRDKKQTGQGEQGDTGNEQGTRTRRQGARGAISNGQEARNTWGKRQGAGAMNNEQGAGTRRQGTHGAGGAGGAKGHLWTSGPQSPLAWGAEGDAGAPGMRTMIRATASDYRGKEQKISIALKNTKDARENIRSSEGE
ncbi:variant surface antigen B-like [Penaeus vannamei]|uniref:variant surface antigen B-like n=1 Tax=Penaeus vannamei TaxID=6689 RepID=UPI00387F6332